MMYRDIDFVQVTNTLAQLKLRVEERFNQNGLLKVCEELIQVADETKPNLTLISKPNYWLRGSVAFIISLGVIFIGYGLSLFEFADTKATFAEVIQISESAVNDVILVSLAIFFLTSLETRIKRAKIIEALNELRAIAHIVDMHQLTKDPTELGESNRRTASSPKRYLSAYELKRYLDYCSEMLAIIGKIAALYAQNFPDATIISSVNEIESLTSGISRKAWQKIMILQQSKVSK